MANSNIDARMIRTIADSIATKVAEQVAKSISAHLIKEGVKERTGRGGDSNRQSPEGGALSGSGQVKSVKDLKKSIDDLNRSTKAFGGKLEDLGKFGKNIRPMLNPLNWKDIPANYQQAKLDEMTAYAEEYRDSQDKGSIYHDLASSTIEYIKASGTQIKTLGDLAQTLSDQRQSVHRLSQSMESAGANSYKLTGEFNRLMLAIKTTKDANGESVDLLKGLNEKYADIISDMRTNGIEVDETTERYRQQQKVLSEMSVRLQESAETVSEVTTSVTDNYTQMARSQNIQMLGALKFAIGALTFGVGQVVKDWVRSFDYLQPASYDLKEAATVMGMSMSELQDGMMQYRDVLRSEAILAGGSMFDGNMMRNIQNMGNSIGLTGTEAFNFGMRMRETSTRLGMSAQASQDSYATMMDFYKQGALAMNMTVSEFGDYMNELSSDPAFVGLSNVIRAQGGDVQSALANEIKLRARTNRLLGLSNEQIKEQIMLENAKRWAPITERYQSEVQGNLLVRQLERMSGMDLSPEAEAAFKQFNFDPKMMNDAQRELMATEVRPFLATAQGMYNEGLAKASADMTREQALAFSRQQAVPQELVRLFASGSGMMEYLQQSEVVMANLEKVITGTNFTREDVLAAISGGMERNEQNAELFDRIDNIMGAGAEEQALLDPDSQGRMETVVGAMDLFRGAVMGGLTKILGGVVAIVGILGKGFLLRKLGLNSLRGVGTGVFGSGGIDGPLKNAGKNASTAASGMGKLSNSIIGKGGLLLASLAAGKVMWDLGYAWGEALYQVPMVQNALANLIDGSVSLYDRAKNVLGLGEERGPESQYGVTNEQAADARRNRLLARLDQGKYTAGYTTVAEIQKMTADELAKATKEIIDYNQKKMQEAEVVEQSGSTGKNQTQLMEETNEKLGQLVDKSNELVVHERDKKEENNNARQRMAEMQRAAAEGAANWKNTINTAMAEAEANYSLHGA